MKSVLQRIDSIITLLFFKPEVSIDVVFDQGKLFLVLENQGRSSAHRINATFRQPLVGLNGTKRVSDQALFHKTEFLPAGKKIETYLDTTRAYFAREEPTLININIVYEDRFAHRFIRNINHDLAIYQDIGYITQ